MDSNNFRKCFTNFPNAFFNKLIMVHNQILVHNASGAQNKDFGTDLYNVLNQGSI